MQKKFQHIRHGGFTILLSVLVIGSVALAVGVSLMFLSTKSLQTTESIQLNSRAKELASACAEKALEVTQTTGGSLTNGGLTLSGDTCTYAITSLGGTARRIEAISTVGSSVQTIVVTLNNYSDTSTIATWTEQ